LVLSSVVDQGNLPKFTNKPGFICDYLQVTRVVTLLLLSLGLGHGQLIGTGVTTVPTNPTQLLLAGLLAASLVKKGEALKGTIP
jgi:hypothetical protein